MSIPDNAAILFVDGGEVHPEEGRTTPVAVCVNCGRRAELGDTMHYRQSSNDPTPGCGVTFTHLVIKDEKMLVAVVLDAYAWRPDLQFLGMGALRPEAGKLICYVTSSKLSLF